MNRRIMVMLTLLLSFMTAAHSQLLYKISGDSLKQPSYIIGTFHLAGVGFVEQIPGVKEALTNTQQVYGELVTSDMRKPENMARYADAMKLPEGNALESLLTPEQMKRLNVMLKKYMNVDFSNPVVKSQMGCLKPVALATQLSMLIYMTNHMGDFDPTNTFDDYFQMQALKNNEPVGALETLDYQLNLLFSSQTIERQVEKLMCLVDNQEDELRSMEEMAKAFYSQNLEALDKVLNAKNGSPCDDTEEEKATMITNRNVRMAEKMVTIMAQKPTFFAVGAAHLSGKEGILQLLRSKGYAVEGVK